MFCEQAENRGTRVRHGFVVHVALGRGRACKGALGQALSGNGAEPLVANGIAPGEAGEHARRFGCEDARNVARDRAGNDVPFLGCLPTERMAEIGDETVVRSDRRS